MMRRGNRRPEDDLNTTGNSSSNPVQDTKKEEGRRLSFVISVFKKKAFHAYRHFIKPCIPREWADDDNQIIMGLALFVALAAALVMALILFPKRDPFPGLFWNGKLHILGVRLTTSYDNQDQSVFFDMFGHAVGEGAHARLQPRNPEAVDSTPILSFKDASQQTLYCLVHTGRHKERIPMTNVPSISLDRKSENVHLIWRCDISAYITKFELMQQSYVRVSVFSGPQQDRSAKRAIMTADINVDTGSLGHAGPFLKSEKYPSFVKQVAQDGPVDVVLCVGGIVRLSTVFLPEFVQHHINVGFSHIVLGLDTMDEPLVRKLQSHLSHNIEQGMVVLAISSGVAEDSQVRKLRFYNQCLYHAKGMSAYVMTLDLDELWVPPRPETNYYEDGNGFLPESARHLHRQYPELNELWYHSAYRNSIGIREAIESMKGKNDCNDWCFQTFSSSKVERREDPRWNAVHPKFRGYFGFPLRYRDTNQEFQRAVARTKYTFQLSDRYASSCRRSPNNPEQEYTPMFPECPLLKRRDASQGLIHHYYNLYRPDLDKVENTGMFRNQDEYTRHMRDTTVAQLARVLHRKKQAK